MNQKFKKVPYRGTTAKEVLALWQEGRLYTENNAADYSEEEIKDNVRAYVRSLRTYATPPFLEHIDALWEEILDNELYLPFIIPDARTRKCKELNKNGIMRLVGVLRSIGVYQNLTDSALCFILEHNAADCSYRAYLGKGVEDEIRQELKRLRNCFLDFSF